MSAKYKVGDNEIPHFITFSVVNFVDVFTRNDYKDILVSSLNYCIKEKGLILNAWIIMSNHIHLILKARVNYSISDIIRNIKKFTSKEIIKAVKINPKESRKAWMLYLFEKEGKRNSNNKNYQFWDQDYHPIELYEPLVLQQKLNYLHENPVRAGIVEEAEMYSYSSAVDYLTNKKGKIAIEHLT